MSAVYLAQKGFLQFCDSFAVITLVAAFGVAHLLGDLDFFRLLIVGSRTS